MSLGFYWGSIAKAVFLVFLTGCNQSVLVSDEDLLDTYDTSAMVQGCYFKVKLDSGDSVIPYEEINNAMIKTRSGQENQFGSIITVIVGDRNPNAFFIELMSPCDEHILPARLFIARTVKTLDEDIARSVTIDDISSLSKSEMFGEPPS